MYSGYKDKGTNENASCRGNCHYLVKSVPSYTGGRGKEDCHRFGFVPAHRRQSVGGWAEGGRGGTGGKMWGEGAMMSLMRA